MNKLKIFPISLAKAAASLCLGALMLAPCAAAPKRFVVTDYHAVGDGKTLNTKAIQNAIDQCSASGGGVVVIPKGTFLTGAIFLKQGANLCLEKEAVLKGSQANEDYPWIDTRIAGLEMKWPAALVNAQDLQGVEI